MGLPEPYYTSPQTDDQGRPRAVLYCGDCREIAPLLDGVGAVVSDPPYGIAYEKGKGGGAGAYRADAVKRNIEPIYGDDSPFDPSPWLDYEHVLLWGCDHFAARLPHGRWIAWDKLDGRHPWDSFSDVEFAWEKGRGKAEIVRYLWKGLCQPGRGEKRDHPTQKPAALMEWCTRRVPTSDIILDPYMGSGTTGVACAKTGHAFVGIEIEERYCEIAARRIDAALSQTSLFPP